MPSPAWYDADTDDADRHRTRDAIGRLDARVPCDDLDVHWRYTEAIEQRDVLRAKVARVEALAYRWETVPALRRGTCAADLRAALADALAPARHDDTQDGAR